MRNAVIRWSIYFAALLLAGPGAGWLILMTCPNGGWAGSPLVCPTPLMGIGAALAAVAIALVIGLVSVRFIGLPHAMTASGYVLAWAAWRSGQVDELIRASGTPFASLAAEGLILGVAGVACAFALSRASGSDSKAPKSPLRALLHTNTLVSVLVGTVAGGVAAWLIAATPLKGQAVFAAIGGGVFAAAACRLVQFDSTIPSMFIPIAILMILGPVSGLLMTGSAGAVAASYKGALFPLAHVTPMDWLAGGMLGLPIGVSWAGSMIEKRTPETSTPAPASTR